jgi:DNA-binding transcriptional MerR regulator
MTDPLLRIGEVAAQAGVSIRTVDYYTGLGLIAESGRTPGNYRLYHPVTADRISAIRQLEAHGVPLDAIAAALNGMPGSELTTMIGQLESDLSALQRAGASADPQAQALLTAVCARAHNLITTAIEMATALPPPG